MATSPTTPAYRLEGSWLFFTRVVWVVLTLLAIFILAGGMWETYRRFSEPLLCTLGTPLEQTTCIANAQALVQLGLPIWFYGPQTALIMVVEAVPMILVGILIFSRKSHELFGWLFSLVIVFTGTISFDPSIPYFYLQLWGNYPALILLGHFAQFIGGTLIAFWCMFPDGHFVPRWTRWLPLTLAVLTFFSAFFPNSPFDYLALPQPFPRLITYLYAALIAYSLIYRYHHIADGAQRQQIKWVVVTGAFFVFMIIIDPLPFTHPGISEALRHIFYDSISTLVSILIAVGIAFSIMRYRLWDIDFIINRSLVYGALTVLLALVFGGSLFLVSRIVEGQNFVLAFGITALIAGTSFNPTRRRIQRFVDQRFYNINIDYQKTPPFIATGSMTQVLRETQFGAYRNLELIGRGGMAEVYKSMHPTLNQPVAIKILPAQLAEEAEFRQRFTREAQVVSKLTHPNIVRMFDSGEQEGKYYMVMEYLTGQDLDKFIRTHGRLPVSQALPLIQQIAAALDYAHSQGFIHRDIKPSNVLLDTSNSHQRAILTDFGIAKILNSQTAMTRTGSVMGTFDYIAPEQIQESSTLDGRADIYALGIMVYQMLTGELPFKHNNPGALLIAHLTQPPPDSCKLLPDLPERICGAIQKAMAKKPEERFATASEFAAALN
jgi:predicted Ser/Thr protein kinase